MRRYKLELTINAYAEVYGISEEDVIHRLKYLLNRPIEMWTTPENGWPKELILLNVNVNNINKETINVVQ